MRNRIVATARVVRVPLMAVGLILLLKWELGSLPGLAAPFLLLHTAVLISTFEGGLASGLVATALAALAGYFWASQAGMTPDQPSRVARAVVFVLEGALISLIGERMHAAGRRAQASARRAREHLDALARSEALLRASQERYRAFVEQSSEGIWCFETPEPMPEGLSEDEQVAYIYGHGRLAECNDATARMYAYDRAEQLVGRPLSDLFVASEPANEALLRNFVRSGYRLVDAESHEHDREGRPRVYLNNVVGILEGGRLRRAWGTQRDVTERTRAEEELRAGERRYRLLFERNMAGVARASEDGRILDANEAMARMYGCESPEELRSRDGLDFFFDPADRPALAERLGRERALTNVEFRGRRKDGGLVWALANLVLVEGEAGAAEVQATFVDITERKRAEEALLERTRLSELSAEVGAALARGDAAGDVLQLCAEALVRHLDVAFARIWTIDPEADVLELQASAGQYTHRDGPHGRVPVGALKVGLIAREGRPLLSNDIRGDARISDPAWAGREGMVAFAGYPLSVEGRIVGVIAAFARQPLSQCVLGAFAAVADGLAQYLERRRAEAALARERNLFRALLDNVPDRIYFKDADGRLTRVGRATADAFGFDDPADMLGKTDFDFFDPDSAREFFDEEREIMRTGVPVVRHEEQETWKDGRVTWALTTKMALRDEAGRVAGTFGISTDITDHKRAEAALRRAYVRQRLSRRRLRVLSRRLVEAQEAERRRIARELHDEVGQVLTGLKLSLEMADRRAAGGDGTAAPLAEAKGLVNGLMARVRALSLDLRPTMLDDLGLLPALLWQFEQYAARTGVRVDFEHAGLERRFRPEVETAAYRIAQEALTNVARHAGVAEVRVRLWADGTKLGLRVEDRGAGFDAAEALAGRVTGGLSGMRERAALLRGKLALESAPGRGTALAVELPLDTPSRRETRTGRSVTRDDHSPGR
jgi:PAS domain S-box-containing protein